MKNHVPLPQDTRLYEVNDSGILEPRLSILELNYNCTASQYSDLSNHKFLLQSYSQNFDSLLLKINDKNVSALRSGPYFSLDGFDYGFTFKFLNISSPTIGFMPLIKGIDIGANVPIGLSGGYGIINPYSSYITVAVDGPEVNDYIVLTNQSNTSENLIYRITSISGAAITIYNDTSINSALTQNQNYIFTRIRVDDSLGTSYYGLYYNGGYNWISQTEGIKLPNSNYGIVIENDLNDFNLNISVFTAVGISPNINETIAISVDGGGNTSGIYIITEISNNKVYFESIYPAYVFIHQFTKVDIDFNTLSNNIWYVNQSALGNTNYLYGTVNFSFLTMSANDILVNPDLWATQVGSAADTILGFSVFNNSTDNTYINNSDIFYLAIKAPTWVGNNSVVEGLSLNINYVTNPLKVLEGI